MLSSCSSAKKRGESENPLIATVLPVARPVSEDTLASLMAIADSPSSHLPPNHAAASADGGSPYPADDAAAEAEDSVKEIETSSPDVAAAFTAPASWSAPGINPEEVNPGDLFFEKEGPVLRKVMSLLDELPAEERTRLLQQFTRTTTARVPVTLSRKELAGLSALVEEGTVLPTRSVALDCRTTTHALDPDRYLDLLSAIGKGGSAGAISSSGHLDRLRKQLAAAKKRLGAGDALYLVTSVSESERIEASYPGAPVGKRDVEPVRNAVVAVYPHLRGLEAGKTGENITLAGNPRLLWEFRTREVKLEGGRLVVGEEEETASPAP